MTEPKFKIGDYVTTKDATFIFVIWRSEYSQEKGWRYSLDLNGDQMMPFVNEHALRRVTVEGLSCILATEYIALLRNRADDIEWETGDFERADTLRAYAAEIEASGEQWVPLF